MDIDQMMVMANKYADDANFYKQGLERVIKEREEEQELVDAFNDAPDYVNSPPHYEINEVLTVYQLRAMLAEKAEKYGMDYAAFSDWDRALEYLLRAPFKNLEEDVYKAIWYAEKLALKLKEYDK